MHTEEHTNPVGPRPGQLPMLLEIGDVRRLLPGVDVDRLIEDGYLAPLFVTPRGLRLFHRADIFYLRLKHDQRRAAR